jgi:hypothetical protein
MQGSPNLRVEQILDRRSLRRRSWLSKTSDFDEPADFEALVICIYEGNLFIKGSSLGSFELGFDSPINATPLSIRIAASKWWGLKRKHPASKSKTRQ